MIILETDQLQLVTKTGTYHITADVFWRAFAGSLPTATQAGILLADSVSRWLIQQQMAQAYKEWQHIVTLMLSNGARRPPLPSYQVDPFVVQALEAFDGSEEVTRVLACILKQKPETIIAWAALLGKASKDSIATSAPDLPLIEPLIVPPIPDNPGDNPESTANLQTQSIAVGREHAPVHQTLTTSLTDEQAERIRTEYAKTSSVKEMVIDLAREFGCMEHTVRNKLYAMRLPKKQKRNQPLSEAQSSPSDQEGD
jgi:hypothetical protein